MTVAGQKDNLSLADSYSLNLSEGCSLSKNTPSPQDNLEKRGLISAHHWSGTLGNSSLTRLRSNFLSVSKIETFYGMVETPEDALCIFQLCREGKLGRVRRRLHDHERKQIRSGSVFVFNEQESGIKRWTDGRLWSPSRIFGDFLIYRELERKYARRQSLIKQAAQESAPSPTPTLITSYHLISASSLAPSTTSILSASDSPVSSTSMASTAPFNNPNKLVQPNVRSELLDAKFKSSFFSPKSSIAISLNNSNNIDEPSPAAICSSLDAPKSLFIIKEDGLIKKTLSMTIDGQLHHLICYYSKEDFFLGRESKSLPSLPPLHTISSSAISGEEMSINRQQMAPRQEDKNKRKRRYSSSDVSQGILSKQPFPPILPLNEKYSFTPRAAGVRANSHSGIVTNGMLNGFIRRPPSASLSSSTLSTHPVDCSFPPPSFFIPANAYDPNRSLPDMGLGHRPPGCDYLFSNPFFVPQSTQPFTYPTFPHTLNIAGHGFPMAPTLSKIEDETMSSISHTLTFPSNFLMTKEKGDETSFSSSDILNPEAAIGSSAELLSSDIVSSMSSGEPLRDILTSEFETVVTLL